MMLWPCLSRCTCVLTSSAVPSTNMFLNTRDGRSSGGIGTPLRVKDSLRLDDDDSTSEANRVSGTSFSMAYWSSEMVFLKLSGAGAARR